MTPQTAALARLISSTSGRTHPDQQCELCGAAIPSSHQHVLAMTDQTLRCACRACGLLFEKDTAAQGQYRLVPQRRIRLAAADDIADQIGVPVGLVFLLRQPDGTVAANYPSPLGVTRSALDEADWRLLTTRWPVLATLAPYVEAVLLNSTHGARDRWLVPIDDCYRLAAIIRQHWKGLSGGQDVWPAVSTFFAGLAAGPQRHPAQGA